jgi:hypothetical protein
MLAAEQDSSERGTALNLLGTALGRLPRPRCMGEYMLAMGTVRQDVTVYAFGANFVEAVFNATGKRVRALPIRSEKLL